LFDFHGVLDLSQTESCRVITELVAKGGPVGILSYSRSQDTISNTLTYVQEICDRTEVMIPFVIAPRPLRKNCWRHTDWSKSDFLWWLLQDTCLQVWFLDDRVDIVQECCHRVGSKNLGVIFVHSTPRIGTRHQRLVTFRQVVCVKRSLTLLLPLSGK